MKQNSIRIRQGVTIPLSEIRFRASRASGPGGQKVNRTASRVELYFDVANSPSLNQAQRRLLRGRLGKTLDSRGVLHLTCQETPSQWRNRQLLLARFRKLLDEALRPLPKRIPTRPPRSAREARLRAKRRRSEIKRLRRTPIDDR